MADVVADVSVEPAPLVAGVPRENSPTDDPLAGGADVPTLIPPIAPKRLGAVPVLGVDLKELPKAGILNEDVPTELF